MYVLKIKNKNHEGDIEEVCRVRFESLIQILRPYSIRRGFLLRHVDKLNQKEVRAVSFTHGEKCFQLACFPANKDCFGSIQDETETIPIGE